MQAEHEITALATKLGELRVDGKKSPRAAVSSPEHPTALRVTVVELPTPPFSPAAQSTTFAPELELELQPALEQDQRHEPELEAFQYFPLLPAELRLKIWHLSFLPRTIELHARRTHYADDDRHVGTPQWLSHSRNPAALAVSPEARAAALEFYSIALPLAAPIARNENYPERPGDLLRDSDRLLYLNLDEDTVVLLGDLHWGRLKRLIEWFRQQDAAYHSAHPWRGKGAAGGNGKGLRRLAMSVAPWAHAAGAVTLKAFARTLFTDIEEFVLFMYKERMPPETWSGGRCLLEEACAEEDYYRRFVIGRGQQFRDGNGWMVVGKQPLKVVEIHFLDGW